MWNKTYILKEMKKIFLFSGPDYNTSICRLAHCVNFIYSRSKSKIDGTDEENTLDLLKLIFEDKQGSLKPDFPLSLVLKIYFNKEFDYIDFEVFLTAKKNVKQFFSFFKKQLTENFDFFDTIIS